MFLVCNSYVFKSRMLTFYKVPIISRPTESCNMERYRLQSSHILCRAFGISRLVGSYSIFCYRKALPIIAIAVRYCIAIITNQSACVAGAIGIGAGTGYRARCIAVRYCTTTIVTRVITNQPTYSSQPISVQVGACAS